METEIKTEIVSGRERNGDGENESERVMDTWRQSARDREMEREIKTEIMRGREGNGDRENERERGR